MTNKQVQANYDKLFKQVTGYSNRYGVSMNIKRVKKPTVASLKALQREYERMKTRYWAGVTLAKMEQKRQRRARKKTGKEQLLTKKKLLTEHELSLETKQAPKLTRITATEAEKIRKEKSKTKKQTDLTPKQQKMLMRQKRQLGGYQDAISLLVGKTAVNVSILSEWQVQTIIQKAIDIVLQAYEDLSAGGRKYEELYTSPRLSWDEATKHVEQLRENTMRLQLELQQAVETQTHYSVAYRIESYAPEFYKKEQEFVNNPYVDEKSVTYRWIVTVLYTAIVGDDIPQWLEEDLAQYGSGTEDEFEIFDAAEFFD